MISPQINIILVVYALVTIQVSQAQKLFESNLYQNIALAQVRKTMHKSRCDIKHHQSQLFISLIVTYKAIPVHKSQVYDNLCFFWVRKCQKYVEISQSWFQYVFFQTTLNDVNESLAPHVKGLPVSEV